MVGSTKYLMFGPTEYVSRELESLRYQSYISDAELATRRIDVHAEDPIAQVLQDSLSN